MVGAKFSSYDKDAWITALKAFVNLVVQKHETFVFAVCFGHQIVAESLGGAVTKNCQGWEAGSHDIILNPSRLSFDDRTSLKINQMHQDIVSRAPEGFKAFASTPICENHGMISEDGRIVTIQGHPEFTLDFMKGVIKYIFLLLIISLRRGKVFDDEFADTAIANTNKPPDGILFVSTVLKSWKLKM